MARQSSLAISVIALMSFSGVCRTLSFAVIATKNSTTKLAKIKVTKLALIVTRGCLITRRVFHRLVAIVIKGKSQQPRLMSPVLRVTALIAVANR